MPSFVGFLYLSAGLALMFAAIQQGERLDWWRSGVFNAIVLVRLVPAIVRARTATTGPNPLVALPYLWQWNTVLLGALLFWFRFTLTGTIILIPQSLAIHGFEADQIGPAVIWSAASSVAGYVYSCAPAASETRPSPVAGCRLGLHSLRRLFERSIHHRLVGGELLSHRAAHGRRTSVCSHRAGGMHRPAGSLLRGVGETSVDPDILCVLSYHPLIWWNHGGRVHGPLSRRPREAALEPFGSARDPGKLDHRRKHSRLGGGTLRQVIRCGCGRQPVLSI